MKRLQHQTCSNKADCDEDKKHESQLSGNKHLPQSKQSDSSSSPKSSVALVTSSSLEAGMGKGPSTSARKSGSTNEVSFTIHLRKLGFCLYLVDMS